MKALSTSLFIAAITLLGACTGTPTLEETPSSEFAGLNVVSSSGFSKAWGRPGTKLTEYKVIDAQTLQSANAEIVQPSSSGSVWSRKDWELTAEREQALASAWNKAVEDAAAKHGLDTSGSGDKVLRIETEITRIAPSVNAGEMQNSPGRSTVYTEDSGDASVEFRLYDQASGELLVVIRDNRRVGSQMWGRASTVSISADVRNLLSSWANRLLSRVSGN